MDCGMNCDVILNFHGVGTPRRTLEPGEAPYWIGAERFREIVALIGDGAPRRVGITFDDGNASESSPTRNDLVQPALWPREPS